MSMKPLSLTLPERERALLLCLFALFLIALCQVLLSLVSGEVSVISESFLPWRMVAYSLLAYPSATFHSKKRERAIAFTSLIRRGSSKAPLRVEISPPAECKYRAGSSFHVEIHFFPSLLVSLRLKGAGYRRYSSSSSITFKRTKATENPKKDLRAEYLYSSRDPFAHKEGPRGKEILHAPYPELIDRIHSNRA
ncbi:hypothetical protein WN944_023891 [Citrus x changshan-huyou]|uniref:Uncharacterized protein n=1 Tax=Citrus x changshan-huyou TaxID=2935761 RepID=A0AAP0QAP3_9ROSI